MGGGGLNSGASEVFIHTLETVLFEKLGQCIGSTGVINSEPSCFASLGREAMMMMGAAGVSSSQWWVWWVPGSDKQRVFFDAENFTVAKTFPADGVDEICTFSKPDTNDSTGMIRWREGFHAYARCGVSMQ